MSEETNASQSCSEENPENQDEVLTLTINDVLDYEESLIEQSAAVLGAANDKNCSYVEGYMKRQALYSCLTCIPAAREDPTKAAGICLACSYHCHEGHELIELYTKRNFRCDCGNRKFAEFTCNLYNEKSELNELNSYNQNFSGTYCTCHRPYPDPDDSVQDEMIQCIVCEDWYHSRHLSESSVPENFAEMICKICVEKHPVLLHYEALCAGEAEAETVDVTAAVTDCKKPKVQGAVGAKFWREESWRKELCTCDECLKLYENEDIAFLLDPEDPVHLYEEKGKAKNRELVETEALKELESLDRVALGEFLIGYNDLKENLVEYLKKFVVNGKVIKVEDIKEFFEGMKARKRRKVEMPYYCR